MRHGARKTKPKLRKPHSQQKQYISGHDVRRFFLISMNELKNVPEHAKKKNESRYELYELDFLSANYRKRDEVPEHLIINVPLPTQ